MAVTASASPENKGPVILAFCDPGNRNAINNLVAPVINGKDCEILWISPFDQDHMAESLTAISQRPCAAVILSPKNEIPTGLIKQFFDNLCEQFKDQEFAPPLYVLPSVQPGQDIRRSLNQEGVSAVVGLDQNLSGLHDRLRMAVQRCQKSDPPPPGGSAPLPPAGPGTGPTGVGSPVQPRTPILAGGNTAERPIERSVITRVGAGTGTLRPAFP